MTERFGLQVLPKYPELAGLHKQWPRIHKHYNHWWWVLDGGPRNSYFPYNENPTIALNSAYHQLTLLTGREKKSNMRIDVQGRLMQVRFIEIHKMFAKKKVEYFLTDYMYA